MDINKIYRSIIKDYLKIDDHNIKELSKYKESIKELRNSYKSNICKPIYGTDINRDSYMLAYFPYYSILTSEVIRKIKKYINKTEKLKVSIFGCGPSPEIVGISNEINCKRINYNLFDYEAGWKKQLEFAKQYIRNNYNSRATFCEISGCDLLAKCEDCDIAYSKCINELKSSDLFVMQNCLNHITNKEDFINKVKFMIDNAKCGAVFVFIDLNYNISNELFEEIVKQNDNTCIKIKEEYNQEFRISEDINKGITENLFTGETDLVLKRKVKYRYLAMKKI